MSGEPLDAERLASVPSLTALGVLRDLPGMSVFAFDRELHVVLATGAGLPDHDWHGGSPEGRRLADALPEKAFRRLQPHCQAALAGQTRAFDYQPLDDARSYRVEICPLRDGGGDAVGGFVLTRDVTAQRETEEALRGSRGYLQDILDCLNIPVSVKDAEFRIVMLNREYERLQQVDRLRFEGKTVFDLYPPEYAAHFHRDDEHVMASGAVLRNEREVPYPDGSIRLFNMVRAPLRDPSGRTYGLIGTGTDITDERQAAAALHEAKERFEQVFQNAAIGKAVLSLDGRFLQVNRALCALTGYTEASLLRLTFQDITHPDDIHADVAQAQRMRAGDISSYEMEKRYIRADGEIVWALLSASLVRDSEGQPVQYIAQVQDISERRELERGLRERAERDALTGLHNRRRFEQDLERQLARCRRYSERAALLLLDLNDFKRLNDENGHRAGDAALKHVAAALGAYVRDSDIVARWGGDEFVILAPHLHGAEARAFADDIARRVSTMPMLIGDGLTMVSASIGVAELNGDGVTSEEAFALADASMYASKRARRLEG